MKSTRYLRVNQCGRYAICSTTHMRWALQMERLGETVAIGLLQMYYRFHVKALLPELQTTMKEHFDECQHKKPHIVEW